MSQADGVHLGTGCSRQSNKIFFLQKRAAQALHEAQGIRIGISPDSLMVTLLRLTLSCRADPRTQLHVL